MNRQERRSRQSLHRPCCPAAGDRLTSSVVEGDVGDALVDLDAEHGAEAAEQPVAADRHHEIDEPRVAELCARLNHQRVVNVSVAALLQDPSTRRAGQGASGHPALRKGGYFASQVLNTSSSSAR